MTFLERANARLSARRQARRDRTCCCGFIGATRGGLSIHQNSCSVFNADTGPDDDLEIVSLEAPPSVEVVQLKTRSASGEPLWPGAIAAVLLEAERIRGRA